MIRHFLHILQLQCTIYHFLYIMWLQCMSLPSYIAITMYDMSLPSCIVITMYDTLPSYIVMENVSSCFRWSLNVCVCKHLLWVKDIIFKLFLTQNDYSTDFTLNGWTIGSVRSQWISLTKIVIQVSNRCARLDNEHTQKQIKENVWKKASCANRTLDLWIGCTARTLTHYIMGQTDRLSC